MTETVTIPKEEIERLEERVKKLAMEKSYLQLVTRLLDELSAASGLENTIDKMLLTTLQNIGSTSIKIYYVIDNDIYYADVFGKKNKLEAIDDAPVKKVFETRMFIELEEPFSATQMTTPEFTKSNTWIFPLLVGQDIIGVCKMEGMLIAARQIQPYLQTFFNHVTLILKNEILGETRLKKAYDQLSKVNANLINEVARRKGAEEALEKKVLERTAELRNINEALRRRETELEEAQRVGQVGSWQWIVATDAIIWSKGYYRIIGRDPALPPPNYKEHLKMYADESATRLDAAVAESLKNGTPYELDLELLHPDGSRRFMVARGEAVCNMAGEVAILRGTLQDITGRKKAETELRASEQRLDQHLMHTPLGVIEWNLRFKIIKWNPAAETIFGYRESEAIGSNASLIVPPGSKEDVDQVWGDLIRKNGGTRNTNENITKDGRIIICEWYNTPLVDEAGNIIGVASLVQDITVRKRDEEALKQYTEELKRSNEEIQRSYERTETIIDGVINTIGKIVETRDPYTAGHENHVALLAEMIAREMGFTKEKIIATRIAGAIHDVGKIYVPAEILSKPGLLSELEMNMVKVHAAASYEILKIIEFPWPVAQIVLQHQERFDGSGYPNGLKGEQILLEARVVSVADVVEAMSFPRPYREAYGQEKALEEIARNRGILYDSNVVDACLRLFREKRFSFEIKNIDDFQSAGLQTGIKKL
jgi:PAS domain S-box-containing protein